MFHQPLLNDHAANRMPDQDGRGRADLTQEVLESVGQCRNAGWQRRRRAAVTRHIPGDGMIAVAECFELAAPCPRSAADPVQEHQWHQLSVARGVIAEAAVAGLQAYRSSHFDLRYARTS